MKKITFKKIVFLSLNDNELQNVMQKEGLFVFPSAPGLASIENEKKYYNSLKQADYVFFDSSFFVILLNIFKNIKVKRLSGYKFLKYFLNF